MREALMRYLDGESPPDEVAEIERRLAQSTELARELALFRALKADLASLTEDTDIRDSVWDRVSRSVARPVGWMLLVVGMVVWGLYASWVFLASPGQLTVKLATAALVVGLLLLLASVSLERYRAWQIDPYRDVHR